MIPRYLRKIGKRFAGLASSFDFPLYLEFNLPNELPCLTLSTNEVDGMVGTKMKQSIA